jgi:hypothetical protein
MKGIVHDNSQKGYEWHVGAIRFLRGSPFWGELSQTEQKTVKEGTEEAAAAHRRMRQSRLEVAWGLSKVYTVLGAKGHWTKYLHTLEHSQRSSYRWFNRLNDLALPAPVVEGAIAQGVDLIHGSYAAPLKRLHPPKKLDEKAVAGYLEELQDLREKYQNKTVETVVEPAEAELKAWRAVVRQWTALKGTRRSQWALRLIGRLMAEMGLPAQRIEPEAVPEDFRPKPGYPAGRPRK